MKYLGLVLSLIAFFMFIQFNHAAYLLPDGNVIMGMQYDGNFVSNNTTWLTSQDTTEITRIASEGYTTLTVDVPMKWVWRRYTGVIANDFNWDGIDAVCDYALTKGMYCALQPIVDGTGYYNVVPTYTFLDTNFSLTKSNTMRDFKSTATAFTADANEISIWDNDINTIYTYALRAFAEHAATKASYAVLIAPPNEGWYTRNGIENTLDANNAWYLYKIAKYGSVAAMNTAYGTAYADWNNAMVRTTSDSYVMQYDWWTMRSERAGSLYAQNSITMKTYAPTKIVTTIKITNANGFTLDMGSSGAGRMGYLHGVDLNSYLSKVANYVDMIAYDAYPDQTDLRKQSLLLEVNYGFIKGLGDYYNKPVYLSEVFPTVMGWTSAVSPARAKYLAQQLIQSLAFVGAPGLGIRGASIFSWKWTAVGGNGVYDSNLNIRDTNSETMLINILPLMKSEYKYATNTTNSEISICNNTNLDLSLFIRYYHDETLQGFIDALKRKSPLVNKYYINNCANVTENALFVNQINYTPSTLTDLNTAVNNGLTLIGGFRGLENVDANTSVYGTDPGFTKSWKNATSQAFWGATFGNPSANATVDANVVDNNNIIRSTLNKNNIFFKPINPGLGSTGYEVATVTTAHMDANRASNTAMLMSKTLGNGSIVKFNWNTADLTTNNTYQTNFDKLMGGLLNYTGMLERPTDINASYGWETDNVTMFNAFGDTNYRYIPATTGTYYYIKITDNNTVSTGFFPPGSIDINLLLGQSIILVKDLNTLGVVDPTLPVTSLVKTKIPASNDNNITLTCTDPSGIGCRTITYNVDNTGDVVSSKDAFDFNQTYTLGNFYLDGNSASSPVFFSPYLVNTYTFDANENYLKQINYVFNGGPDKRSSSGFPLYVGYMMTRIIYVDGTDLNKITSSGQSIYNIVVADSNTQPTKAVKKIEIYQWIGASYEKSHSSIGNFQFIYDKNYSTQLDSNSTTFRVYGAGSHSVVYYSTTVSGKIEVPLTYTWSDTGSAIFNFYDENTGLALSGVTVSSTLGDNVVVFPNSFDGNLLGIVGTEQVTYTFSKTGYATRYYQADLNSTTSITENISLNPSNTSTDVVFKFFAPDQTTILANSYVTVSQWYRNTKAGRLKTDSEGKVTFSINASDGNYGFNISYLGTSYDYNSILATIYKPKDEATGIDINASWNITVSGIASVSYTNLTSATQVLLLYANTFTPYQLRIDSNSIAPVYYSRNYQTQLLGYPASYSLQTYLISTTSGYSVGINVQGASTLLPIAGIDLKIYRLLSGGRTLVDEEITNTSGDATTSMITNQTYYIDVYQEGAFLQTITATGPSSAGLTIWIRINENFVINTSIPATSYLISYSPFNQLLHSYDTNLIQTITKQSNDTNLTTTSITITVTNTNVGGTPGNNVVIYTNTINSPGIIATNNIDINYSTRKLNGVTYDANGALEIRISVLTNQGVIVYSPYTYRPYNGSTNIVQAFGFDIRPMFGCSATNNANISCGSLIMFAVFIAICIAVVMSLSMGFVSMSSIGFLFIFIMGIFTYIAWVPPILFLIMIAGTFGLIIAEMGRRV